MGRFFLSINLSQVTLFAQVLKLIGISHDSDDNLQKRVFRSSSRQTAPQGEGRFWTLVNGEKLVGRGGQFSPRPRVTHRVLCSGTGDEMQSWSFPETRELGE